MAQIIDNPAEWKGHEIEALLATDGSGKLDKELCIVSIVQEKEPKSYYRVKVNGKKPKDFTNWEEAVEYYNGIGNEEKHVKKEPMPEYTREKVLEEFKVMCVDFWGDKKTKTAIKEAWMDNLTVMEEDGYNVDRKWKLTKEEVEELMNL